MKNVKNLGFDWETRDLPPIKNNFILSERWQRSFHDVPRFQANKKATFCLPIWLLLLIIIVGMKRSTRSSLSEILLDDWLPPLRHQSRFRELHPRRLTRSRLSGRYGLLRACKFIPSFDFNSFPTPHRHDWGGRNSLPIAPKPEDPPRFSHNANWD